MRRSLVWWLTGPMVAVLVAALVVVALNAGRMGASRTALNAVMTAAVLLHTCTGDRQPAPSVMT